MGIPKSLRARMRQLPEDIQRQFQKDFKKRRAYVGNAYLAWFFLGWHYLYLNKVGMQFAFWFTGGFLVIGWLIDFFRVPGMVSQFNEDLARDLLVEYRALA